MDKEQEIEQEIKEQAEYIGSVLGVVGAIDYCLGRYIELHRSGFCEYGEKYIQQAYILAEQSSIRADLTRRIITVKAKCDESN